MAMLRRALDRLYLLSGRVAAAFLAAICLLVLCQVGLNLIDRLSTLFTGQAIGLTIPSYADFTGFFLAAASFLALAYSLRSGSHIRVTLVLSHLGPRTRKVTECWCLALAAAVSCYFCCYTAQLTWESFVYDDLSAGMVAVPIWIPQSSMLLGLAVLSVSLVDDLIQLVGSGQASYLLRENESDAGAPDGR